MSNERKLRELFVDVFLLEPGEYRRDLERSDIDTWDSLGTVSLALGLEEAYGVRIDQEELIGLRGVADVVDLLRAKGVPFDG